jgi:acyl carrier protein
MEKTEFENAIKNFIVQELLDGKDAGLDNSTPLLKWGVIDSLSLVSLLSFIEERFGIGVPPAEVNAANFENLTAIADLLNRLSAGTTKTSGFVYHGEDVSADEAAGGERRR